MMPSVKLPVTVVIPTLNEAERISDALCAASQWADQVIVADGGSTDATRELAQEAGVVVCTLAGSTIGAQRNVGAANARNEWIFALDTDERVSDELRDELREIFRAPKFEAYRVRMRNFYLGRERTGGRWGRDWHVRLYKRNLKYCESRVHERLEETESLGTLRGPVLHTPYRDLTHHLTKMITYARWGAQDLSARNRKATVYDLFVRPLWRFIRDYIVHGNFREGRYGLMTSVLTAYSAFLKYAFLYELTHPDVSQGRPDSPGSHAPGQLRSAGGVRDTAHSA
jgi:Glycosyltransferases involved in cell wall biogenesis